MGEISKCYRAEEWVCVWGGGRGGWVVVVRGTE